MTISELIKAIYNEVDLNSDLSLVQYSIFDDEDLILFALRYLLSNIDHALETE